MTTNAEFKRKLIATGLFSKVSGSGQYVCKTCPFCGDMKKHMYVLIKQDDDTPVLYNCFKCNAHGIVNREFIDYFGIDDIEIPKLKGNRKINPNNSVSVVLNLIDFDKDFDMINSGTSYIESRVGVRPSVNDLTAFQLIGNPYGYVDAYLGGEKNNLKGRIWFRLSNGNIIGRATNSNSSRWLKKNYDGGSSDYIGTGVYVIKRPIDPYQTINVCVCEGVMDAIGLYYHSDVNNTLIIACMGRDYLNGIKYAIDAGIFGDSVNVRIYKDSDVENVKIPMIHRMLFKSITIYQNTIGKDFGVPANQIEIERCQ